MGCRVAIFHPARQQEQPARTMGSAPIIGWGRGLWWWLEVMPEGVPMVGSPSDSPEVAGKSMERHMEESEAAEEDDYPGDTAAAADTDEMPLLEVDEAIAELDAAIEEAGEEEEEGPKPLDEADINEAAQQIKDNPMLCMALG